jgi:hypothetical protein
MIESRDLNKYLFALIYNSLKMETTHMPIYKGMDKCIYKFTTKFYQAFLKK